ncbi:TIM23 complex subunit [Komagataella phaffii CBS 7435]|uniref:Mitochondrial import inner membrane translocase subunit TIM16 n=2 Tax=Komagataella phaffii TaxID=460519 RepID=C4QV19_KOMPG|nr:Constituent of the mitochondrial import motor associated with the presequence translocase [Komagataella phaffii GS115]CAH2445743.1 TIM23 complex subunit [Komagataella phaffii CBS 7435]CAY67089.1 Constituent of the mitochondrial import motor associated with the presequence translocase [Komagataella phaffii GS115]CCA36203.1 TIM23 complex subunit [Komagataella phaffii CBS 7435]
MAHRLVTQVIFTGAKVFGRAFTEAYRQAAAATSKQGASAAATAVRDTGISLDEACKILDVQPKGLDNTKIQEKYNYLFDINSKENGGSFYLQSKIYRAKERLEAELKAAEEELKAREGASGKDSSKPE